MLISLLIRVFLLFHNSMISHPDAKRNYITKVGIKKKENLDFVLEFLEVTVRLEKRFFS